MKKLTKSAFIFLLSISMLLIGIGAVSTTSAQEISTENVLLQKLDALVEQLANLSGKEHFPSNDTEVELFATASSITYPGCMDNYQSWPSSSTEKLNSSWNLKNFPHMPTSSSAAVISQFLDVNGDGLSDYVYVEKLQGYNRGSECVLLNNGAGWDIAYRCYFNSTTFYGDCAQL